VLLVHGELDHETAPEHSRRILAALKGDKRLLLVPGAGHNDALRPEVWKEIDGWLDRVFRAASSTTASAARATS
jgi:dipeptidyl aminopeptidase/acylaminoacyl peptidase